MALKTVRDWMDSHPKEAREVTLRDLILTNCKEDFVFDCDDLTLN